MNQALEEIQRRLLSVNPDKMTPLKALIFIEELRSELDSAKDQDIFADFSLST